MHIIHLRMSKPTAEDVKYINNRLSSRFKAKQVLPTLWITLEMQDSSQEEITADLIADDLIKAQKRVSVSFQYFITKGNWEDTQFSLPDDKANWLNTNAWKN